MHFYTLTLTYNSAVPFTQLADCATDLAEATLHAPLDHMQAARPLQEALTTLFAPPQVAEGLPIATAAAPDAAPEVQADVRATKAEAVARRIGLANPAADLERVVQQVASKPGAFVKQQQVHIKIAH